MAVKSDNKKAHRGNDQCAAQVRWRKEKQAIFKLKQKSLHICVIVKKKKMHLEGVSVSLAEVEGRGGCQDSFTLQFLIFIKPFRGGTGSTVI